MTVEQPITPTHPLKPERIGLVALRTARSPLKPERIGLRLQKLPGWELLTAADVEAVTRTFRFHRTATAQAFANFVARAADEHGQRPMISQTWNRVTVVVPGEGAITESVLDFAEVVMLLPPREERETPSDPGASGPTGPIAVVGSDEG